MLKVKPCLVMAALTDSGVVEKDIQTQYFSIRQVELSKEVEAIEPQLKTCFIETASRKVSKGTRPDYIRFAPIPLNFKGAVVYSQLKQDFLDSLKQKT